MNVSFSVLSNLVLKRNVFCATRSALSISFLLFASNASTTARAWSTAPSSPLLSNFPQSSPTRLAAEPTNGESDPDKRPEGKTGWNHNPPKNPDFYSSASEVERIAKEIQPPKTNNFRTGWLHNTESAEKKKAAQSANSNNNNDTKKKPSAAGLARRRLEEAMKAQKENHRIVSPGALHACGNDRLIVVTEHRMSVPLVHAEEDTPKSAVSGMPAMRPPPGKTIDVAFTIVEEVKDEETRQWYETVSPTLNPNQRAAAYVKKCGMTSAKDMILFLQGGPGFGAPTPVVALDFSKGGSSWGSAALDKYRRVVLMDQRGTGKSSPLTKQSLQRRFPDVFCVDNKDDYSDELQQAAHNSLDEATEFVSQFRADNIVKDAELIRKVLMYTPTVDDELENDFDGSDTNNVYDPSVPNPWGCVLGQSFGGFCTMTYLSQVEHPPKICLLTGGIAPMLADSAVEVYTSLWDKVKERNLRFYDMYPGDVAVVKTIVRELLLAEESGAPIRLPSGGKLTARRFLQLGMMLGGSPSSFSSMHNLLSSAFLQPLSKDDPLEFSRGFLKTIDHEQPFDEHPIYLWLHESIYADANSQRAKTLEDGIATKWSADRAFSAKIDAESSDASEYDYTLTSSEESNNPVLFFGEMVFPWMAEDYAECASYGCLQLANALAFKNDWGPLYDAEHMRAVLRDGRSRAAAAVYYEDMYVDFDQCMRVVARGGPLEKCKVYITNEYQHSGVRDDGAAIFNKLHGMATGSVRTPS